MADSLTSYLNKLACNYSLVEYTVGLTGSNQYIVVAPANPFRVVLAYSESIVGVRPSGIRLPSGAVFPFTSGGFVGLTALLTINQHFDLPQQEVVVYDDILPRTVVVFGVVKL